MNRNFDNLKYTDEIMYSIKKNISLLGIVESFFSNLHINKPILKVYPNNKFFYNFCPFHNNSSTCYDFFVDERYHLYYCFGCGARGNAFDFLMSVYSLDINSVADILGAISGQFDVSILTEKELKIYNLLIKNYYNYIDLIKKSKMKTIYLTDRVKKYLELHHLDEPTISDLKKVADRLSCSTDFVRKIYEETPSYKEYQKVKQKKLRLEESKKKYI